MNDINPLNRMIEEDPQMEQALRDAAIDTADALDLCWAAAQAVFQKQAKPEYALAILPLLMAQIDAKRLLPEPKPHIQKGDA